MHDLPAVVHYVSRRRQRASQTKCHSQAVTPVRGAHVVTCPIVILTTMPVQATPDQRHSPTDHYAEKAAVHSGWLPRRSLQHRSNTHPMIPANSILQWHTT